MTMTALRTIEAEMSPDLFHYWAFEWNRVVDDEAPPPPIIEIAGDVFAYDPYSNQIWKNNYEFTSVGVGCTLEEMQCWTEKNSSALPSDVVPYYLLFAKECVQYSSKYGLLKHYLKSRMATLVKTVSLMVH